MNFAWPHLLWLLAAPAALLAREIASKRRPGPAAHPKILRAEGSAHSLTLVEAPANSSVPPRLWLCAGAALAIVALARPQWGRIDEPVFSRSREIVVAIDLSRSMLTPDVAPSRLERAKLLTQSLLDRLAGERVGLVVFSGTAFLQSPLSADYDILREFLPALGPDFMPVGGTNYGALIDTAADAFEGSTIADRFLIVLSDGGATDEHWRDHLGKLKAKGIRVIGLGIGTPAGGFIPEVGGGFMKDDRGAVVLAKLESDTLRELAAKTGGAYRDAGEWIDLPALLKATVEAGRKGQFLEKKTVHYIERYQWPLALALLCLLLSFWREFPAPPTPREMTLKSGSRKAESRNGEPANTARMAVALTVLFVSAFRLPIFAFGAEGAPSPAPEPGALLARMVGRISGQTSASALDWAELGQQTVSWGQQLQSAHQTVAPGPVHDALAAVDAGSALDARATDWRRLRADLEALLKSPEDQKQNKPPPRQNQKQDNQQQQNQPSSPQQQSGQGNQPQDRPQPKPSPFAPDQSKSRSPGEDGSSLPPPPSDLHPQAAKPPGTQQVGGSATRKPRDPAGSDPALAVPLQKLDQIRNQDSPAELFEMLENNEPRPASDNNGKKW